MFRRDTLSLLLLLGLTFAFRLPPILCQAGRIDEECYAVPGLTILRTGLPQLPHFPTRNPGSMFYRADEVLYAEPPLFFYVQAGLYALLSPSYATARLLSLMASLLVQWRIYELTKRWTGSSGAGLLAAGTLGLSRWFHYAAMIARPDMLCTLWGVLAIEAVNRWADDEHRTRWVLLCAAWLGLGGLTHPLAIVFAAQAFLWMAWRARGWQRLWQPALLMSVTLAIFALWLPLILLHPDIFWKQFDNQFLGHSSGSPFLWLLRPWKSVWYHSRFLWLNIGPVQVLLVLVPLVWCTVRALRDRHAACARAAWLAWSGFLFLSLMVGTHHDVPSYWAYPGALMMLTLGIFAATTFQRLRAVRPKLVRVTAAVSTVVLLIALLPGSGARLFVEYVRHWNDDDFHGDRVAQKLLAAVPPGDRCAVAGEFVLNFLAAGRPVLGIPSQPIYFELEQHEVDVLIVSADTPPDLAERECAITDFRVGSNASTFSAWAEIKRVYPCEAQSP